MNNQQITKDNLKKVKELVNNVTSMSNEDYKKYLDSCVNFHNYSYYNQILLWSSGCSQVAGFHKWKSLKRNIKAGSKAVWILAPMFYKRKVQDSKGNIEEKDFILFKSVPVFDISATEGQPIQKNFTTYSAVDYDKLKAIVESFGFIVKLSPMEIATGGFISHKSIWLNSNLNQTENTGTLIHELSHGLLLHAENSDNRAKNIKELEAETLTYLLCKYLNIERKSEFYLKVWELNSDILKSLKKINLAFRKFIEKYEGVKNG